MYSTPVFSTPTPALSMSCAAFTTTPTCLSTGVVQTPGDLCEGAPFFGEAPSSGDLIETCPTELDLNWRYEPYGEDQVVCVPATPIELPKNKISRRAKQRRNRAIKRRQAYLDNAPDDDACIIVAVGSGTEDHV